MPGSGTQFVDPLNQYRKVMQLCRAFRKAEKASGTARLSQMATDRNVEQGKDHWVFSTGIVSIKGCAAKCGRWHGRDVRIGINTPHLEMPPEPSAPLCWFVPETSLLKSIGWFRAAIWRARKGEMCISHVPTHLNFRSVCGLEVWLDLDFKYHE